MLTIVMATHNGARTLPSVLEAYTKLDDPGEPWKVVIADNASSDDTPNIIRDYESRLPIHYLHTETPGKNRALNAALQYVDGDIVIFTDDDAVPDADWLVQWRKLVDATPDCDIFGGLILPVWPKEPPEWFFRLVPLGMTFAITPDDMEDGPADPNRIWGPNMAVRSRVFEAGHRFDETIGPQPGQYRMGSETEFNDRMTRVGYQTWFSHSPRVGHIIRENQMEPEWITKRAYRCGKASYWRELEEQDGVARLFGVPRWRLRTFLWAGAQLLRSKLSGDADSAFDAQWEIQYFLGYWTSARKP